MGLKLKTAPEVEPVTLAELKAQLRISDAGEDALLNTYIVAAREFFERSTNIVMVTQTWELHLDRFPCGNFELPKPPLRQVNSVKYIDIAGAEQTVDVSVYQADNVSRPGRLLLRPGQTWPTPKLMANAVVIEFQAGYGNAASVPELLKNGIKLLCTHWYENRSTVNVGNIVNEMPFAVDAIVKMHMNHRFG
jgi:uncharacterized phiE125 gp8 family phage protein